MTKEELKEEIIKLLLKPISCKMFSDVWLEHKADQILTLIRESGYEPPESVREMVEKSYADGVDDTEQKYKGWKSPEECSCCIWDWSK